MLDQSTGNTFEIKIEGCLDSRWSEWFNSMTITAGGDGTTILTGAVFDDCALHGLLKKIRDWGFPLLSVNPIENE